MQPGHAHSRGAARLTPGAHGLLPTSRGSRQSCPGTAAPGPRAPSPGGHSRGWGLCTTLPWLWRSPSCFEKLRVVYLRARGRKNAPDASGMLPFQPSQIFALKGDGRAASRPGPRVARARQGTSQAHPSPAAPEPPALAKSLESSRAGTPRDVSPPILGVSAFSGPRVFDC